MSKNKTIPAGYRLTITSWENDGDNSRTIVKEGLTREQTEFYVGFIKLFYSDNNHERESKTFGNMYDPDETELIEANQAIGAYLKSNRDLVISLLRWDDIDEMDEDAMGDGIAELHSELFGFGGDGFHFRVLDDFQVNLIPIAVELQDVTEQFK